MTTKSTKVVAPVPLRMCCPWCGAQHLDEGEWATRPHKTHLCLCCWRTFRPREYATVGVADGAAWWAETPWWKRGRGDPSPRGVQHRLIPWQVTTRWYNGWHAWPGDRRRKREAKRLGSRARRHLLRRACADVSDADTE